MSKRLKKLIKQTRHKLEWRVEEITHPGFDTLYITSNPWGKTHKIYIPDKNVRNIEILHEYGHALLCETIHQMLSTHYFKPDPGPGILKIITPAAQAAYDWFVDDWLFRLVPDLERKEILESLEMLLSLPESHVISHPEILTGLALIIAQAIKYCGRTVPTTGILKQAVTALLSVDPSKPTTESITACNNRLLACYCPVQLEPMIDNGVLCWAVNK